MIDHYLLIATVTHVRGFALFPNIMAILQTGSLGVHLPPH